MSTSGHFYITNSEKNEKPAHSPQQQEPNNSSDSMIFVPSHMRVCAVSHILPVPRLSFFLSPIFPKDVRRQTGRTAYDIHALSAGASVCHTNAAYSSTTARPPSAAISSCILSYPRSTRWKFSTQVSPWAASPASINAAPPRSSCAFTLQPASLFTPSI